MAMGGVADEVVLVEMGVVKVILPTGTGPDVVAGLYGPGELVGELGVLYCQPRCAAVIGHQSGIASHVAASTFRDLTYHDRDVRAFVDATFNQRMRNADRRQVAVVSMDVMSRVVAQLSDWAEKYGEPGDDGVVVRGLSHRDLAGAVLASEKHVDAVLHDLRAAGLVRTGRMCFVIPAPSLLRSAVLGRCARI